MPQRIYETLKSKFGILKIPIKVYEELSLLLRLFMYSMGENYVKNNFPSLFNAFGEVFNDVDLKQALKTKAKSEQKKREKWRRL